MTKVAVVQAASVPFDAKVSTQKAVALLAEAADTGAKLVVFPEAFIGGYPKGLAFGGYVGFRTDKGRAEYAQYVAGAVRIEGDEIATLTEAASAHSINVVIGIIERDGNTLYCTALMIDPKRGVVGKHRKLMPTGTERLIWGFGDGSTLDTMDTPAGRTGAVICWENYMPLLRQTMYSKGVEVYCAPTADDRETWVSTMTHIALEGRVHVLSACQYITKEQYPENYHLDHDLPAGDTVMRGGSLIVDPTGKLLAGPVFNEETILYADIDPEAKTRGHLDFDSAGHYSRPDVFKLSVDTSPQHSVSFE